MNRRKHIGFDRRLDLEWLDAAAAQAASGASFAESREYLWNMLDGVVRGDKWNSARGKTLTVLNHIWGHVPHRAAGLKQRAAQQLHTSSTDERLALHWAMMLGTYPIFADTAASIGRLSLLQGQFSLAQLTQRLIRSWGERSTLVRAVQRIVRSMVQWHTLEDLEREGTYGCPRKRSSIGTAVSTILVEALLVDANGDGMPLERAVGHPALFPFDLVVTADQLRVATQFQIHRQGSTSDIVALAP